MVSEDKTAAELGDDSEIVPIVAIGASAGGLRSIEALFKDMPLDTGMAFVIIQHLSPDFKSLMSEIMGRQTLMPISVAEDGMILEANHIYLIPPGKELRCEGYQLALSEFPDGLHKPIDVFFNSLAKNAGVPVAGIVLSGTGSDGSEGIEAIYGAGGLTIAESLGSAAFDGMPINAVRTQCVQHVLHPAEMIDVLLNEKMQSVVGQRNLRTDESMHSIFSMLSNHYNLNFDDYKPSTIERRIERRQSMANFKTCEAYAKYLASDRGALDDLFHDLLIGVAKFFRDEAAYCSLEREVESMLQNYPEGRTFRVWVAGCATGQEAYSMAMVILDVMDRLGRKHNLKIFATDVHQKTLELAAQGIYHKSDLEFVSPEKSKSISNALMVIDIA